MSVSLRNISGEALNYAAPDGKYIEADEVVVVDGVMAPKSLQPDDAVVLVMGDDARAFPLSTWAVVNTTKEK